MTMGINIVKRGHFTSVLTNLSKVLSGDPENVMTPNNYNVAANLFLTSHEGTNFSVFDNFSRFFKMALSSQMSYMAVVEL